MATNLEEKIQTFCSVTGESTERAKFFIESCGGDVDGALSRYFEHLEEDDQHNAPQLASNSAAVPEDDTPENTSFRRTSGVMPFQNTSQTESSQQRQPPSSNRIKTFSELAAGNEEEDEDDRNEYYTGGEKRCSSYLHT